MYAVIKSGGKQYRVTEGEVVRVEKLTAEPGSNIDFDQVLMIGGDGEAKLGVPLVEGGKVSAEVIGHGRNRKIEVIKFKRRKNYRRTYGHRQHFTEVRITGIAG